MARDDTILSLRGDLSCNSCEDRLHLYVEGEADGFTRRAIEAHLRACPSCSDRRRVLEEERLSFLERALVSPALSSRFAERVVEEIRRRDAAERDRRLLGKLLRLGLGGLAAAGITLLAFLVIEERGGAPRPAPAPYEVVSPRAPIGPAPVPEIVDAGGGRPPAPPLRMICELPDLPYGEGPRGSSVAAASAGRHSISDSIEFSASMLRLDERLPCSRDVNRDGETNVSDAALLFMLAVAPASFDFSRFASLDEADQEPCNSLCQI